MIEVTIGLDDSPPWTYPADEWAADLGLVAATVRVAVAQITAVGRHELSKIVPVELTFVESVIVGERLRQIDPAVVDTLAQSIAEIGLQVPITVRLEECPDG